MTNHAQFCDKFQTFWVAFWCETEFKEDRSKHVLLWRWPKKTSESYEQVAHNFDKSMSNGGQKLTEKLLTNSLTKFLVR